MKKIIFTKQFTTGLLLSATLLWLLSIAPPPRAASLPERVPDEIQAMIERRYSFLGDNEYDVLEAELQAEMAEMPRFDQPDEAQRFYAEQRVPPGETAIPVQRYGQALQHMNKMRRYSTATRRFLPSRQDMAEQGMLDAQEIGDWEALGPGNIGGRTRAMLIDPSNPDIMYAAGVSGGVWKTINAGGTWVPLDDLLPNLAVNSMVMDPTDVNTIYVGTGEGYFNFDAVRGDGIFKTTDGGITWTHLASTAGNPDFHYVNDLVISPNDAQRVYAATRLGVLRSINGGTDWTLVLDQNAINGCTDLAIRTDISPNDTIFVACGTRPGVQGGIFRSSDNGDTWDLILTETEMSRTSLAIAPSNQNIIYALASSRDPGPDVTEDGSGDYFDGLHAVFRSTDGGDSWAAQVRNTGSKANTLLLTNPIFASFTDCGISNPVQFNNQGWYDNVIAVDPADPNIVWAGGIDLFRSDDGGQNWLPASYWWIDPTDSHYAHADHHALVFHPGYNGTSNRVMYNGNDGGVFRTDDARAPLNPSVCGPSPGTMAWVNLNNGYEVTQFYHGVPFPDGTAYFGGTQDNGTNQGSDAAGVNNWSQIFGGDGGYVAVDPTNPNILFAETTNLSILKSTDGGATFALATNGIIEDPDEGKNNKNFLFINPFTMDPSNPDILWTGGGAMWRTTDQANSWSQASVLPLTGAKISAHAVAPTDSDFVLAGSQDGTIAHNQDALSADSTTAWPTSKPADGVVSWLTFDPNDKNIAYATYSTFGINHVWKSTDAGATWTAIDRLGEADGIPDIPAHAIAVDPTDSNRLYVGTDLGIFVTTDGGSSWNVENSGFANVVVETLTFNQVGETFTLFAFTHGRGAWRVNIERGLNILDPTTLRQGYAGPHNTPQKLVVRVNKPEDGLTRDKFAVTIGGTPAPIVTLYEGTDEYALEVASPTQPDNGVYDLEVSATTSVETLSAIEAKAVYYNDINNVDVMLVLDRSGSMKDDDKMGAAQASAKKFVDLMIDNDQVGVASFSDDNSVDYPLTPVDDTTQAEARAAIDALTPVGPTSIGGGLQAGQDELVAVGEAIHPWAIVLLSDGDHNTPPDPEDVLPSIQTTKTSIHTVALGLEANELLMQDIALSTDGTYNFALTSADLAGVYNTISRAVTDQQALISLNGVVLPGESDEHDVIVDSTVSEATFSVSWSNGTGTLELTLEDPATSSTIDPAVAAGNDDIDYIEGGTYAYYRIRVPTLNAGTWKMRINNGSVSKESGSQAVPEQRYTAEVAGPADLTVRTYIDGTNFLRGQSIKLSVTLSDENPITDTEVLAVVGPLITIGPPPSAQDEGIILFLKDDGESGDGLPNDGVYAATLSGSETAKPGTYAFSIFITGTSNDGQPFSRQAQRTVFVGQFNATDYVYLPLITK